MSAPACYGLCRCRLAFLCFVLLLYFADFCRTAIYFKGLQIYGNYGGISARGGHLGSAGPKVRLTCLSASALHAALLAQVCGGIAPVFVPFRHFRPSQPWCDSAPHACRAWWLLRVSSLQHCQAWCAGALGAPAGALYLPHSCRTPVSFLPGSAQFVRWTRVLGYSLARGPERLG